MLCPCKTKDSQNVSCSSTACAGGAACTISFRHKLTTMASQEHKTRQLVLVLPAQPTCPHQQVMKTLSINQEVIHMDPGPAKTRACRSFCDIDGIVSHTAHSKEEFVECLLDARALAKSICPGL